VRGEGRSADNIFEAAEAGDLGGGDVDMGTVDADAELAGFGKVEFFGGAGIVAIVDIGVVQGPEVRGDGLQCADVDERALGIEDDDLPEEGFYRGGR